MIPWYWLPIAVVAGAFVTSLFEYQIGYNLIDKIVDFFKSEEAKVKAKL